MMKKILLFLLLSFNLNAAQTTIAILKDVKSSGVNGGTCTSGAWRTRVINTEYVAQDWVSISSNQFTLDEGDYIIRACAPAAAVLGHKISLYSVTGATYMDYGTSEEGPIPTSAQQTDSCLWTYVSFAPSETFEIRHVCNTTAATNGFGVNHNFGDNVYTTVVIEKL